MKDQKQEALPSFLEFKDFEQSSPSCHPVERIFIGQIVTNLAYSNGSEDDLYYYHYDALGNVVAVIDVADNITLYEQDAFGNRIPGSSGWEPMDSPGPKEHLTGKMYDEDSYLYYFHIRWYDPGYGRFISKDPALGLGRHLLQLGDADYCSKIGYCSGWGKMKSVQFLQELSPQRLNHYAFSLDDPINYVDVTGGCSEPPGQPKQPEVPKWIIDPPGDPIICYLHLEVAGGGLKAGWNRIPRFSDPTDCYCLATTHRRTNWILYGRCIECNVQRGAMKRKDIIGGW